MRKLLALGVGLTGCALLGCAPAGVGTTVKKTPAPTPSASAAPISDVPLKEAKVVLRNNRFEPAELTLMQGGRINFVNEDDHTHSVTPVDGAQFLEVLTLAAGTPSGAISFFSQGDHRFRCRFHAGMTGLVHVRYVPGPGGTDSAMAPVASPGTPASAAPQAETSATPSAVSEATPVPSPSASPSATPSSGS